MTVPARGMADPIVWQPTRDALAARLALFGAGDFRAVSGFGFLAALNGAGGFYDDQNTTALRARITAEDADYADRLDLWRGTFGDVLDATDAEARLLEHREFDARSGVTLEPRVGVLPDGTRYPLAWESGAALTLPGGWDEEVVATASRVLSTAGGSPVPVVRVAARFPGRQGNRLEVAVEDDAVATRFRLRVRLGGYVETWESLDATGRLDAPTDASLLVGAIVQVGTGRPATATWAAMAGGAGRLVEVPDERLQRAALLPSSGPVEQGVVAIALQALRDAWAAKPVPPAQFAGTASQLLAGREAALRSALANAERALLVLPAP